MVPENREKERSESRQGEFQRAGQGQEEEDRNENRIQQSAPEPAGGHPERPRAAGVLKAQHNYPGADQDKGEQRADIGQVHHLIYAGDRGEPGNKYSGQDCRKGRSAEPRVDAAERRRQEPIPGHREQDPRLPELEHQQDRRIGDYRAECHDARGPAQARAGMP